MDDLLSPIAKIDMDDYNCDFFKLNTKLDDLDQLNGNVHSDTYFKEFDSKQNSIQSSLEDLVNNFDSIISECFNESDEKLDSIKPISNTYQTTPSSIEKNPIWLSLTGSLDKSLNLDWKSSQTFNKFKSVVNQFKKDDIVNQNLDLPDDDELANAMDHHSRPTGCLPCDFEPIKTADEIINEIDDILGIRESSLANECFVSSLHRSDFIGSQEAINAGRSLLHRPEDWEDSLQLLSTMQLNRETERLEDAVRQFSAVLLEELAEREQLAEERHQRDRFVELVHRVSAHQQPPPPDSLTHPGKHPFHPAQRLIQSDCGSPQPNGSPSPNHHVSAPPSPQRANSWKSIFLSPSKVLARAKSPPLTGSTYNLHRKSETAGATASVGPHIIPVHREIMHDKANLERLNGLLEALLCTHPDGQPFFNQLLTDYILNVYAPAEDACSPESSSTDASMLFL